MSYDDFPYPSLPLAQTHPERCATAATLHGLTPAAIEHCRVLELGCASGGNLIPMAVALPGSQFLGIDLSIRQIDEGQRVVDALGQPNITLRQGDLLALAAENSALGEFDYIICHGVYSWVSAPVQQAILTLCQRHLAPHGIAYISYNTLPGFYQRQPIRDMMLFHLQQRSLPGRAGEPTKPPLTPPEAVRESRALVDLMLLGASERGWAHNLKEETELLRKVPDGYVFHDHLEASNQPLYFHQFITAAQRHGLQFLTEAEQSGPPESFPPAVQQWLKPLQKDVVALEQYLDFLRNQRFRCTLLCRAAVAVTREPALKRLVLLSASCAIWPAPEKTPSAADVRSTAGVVFRSPKHQLTVTDPAMKAVLLSLCENEPRALSFFALGAYSSEMVGKKITDPALADVLLAGYRAGIIRLHVAPPRFALTVSERPIASPLARLQALTQDKVANLRHQIAELNPLEQQVLPLLDGEHDLAALLPPLLQAARAGVLNLARGKNAERDGTTLRQVLTKQLPTTLQTLAGCALLIF